ncbi:MAG: DNA recombination protein RmuC [Thiohalophilus sp.]
MSQELIYAAIAVGALLVGGLGVYLWLQGRINALQRENSQLNTRLELERRHAEEKIKALKEAREQLSDTFSALSSQALKHNNEEFLKLAQQKLEKFQSEAKGDLAQKEKAIEALVRPIRESLNKTEQQIQNIEKERKEAYGALHKHIETMNLTQQALRDQTHNLVQALRRPEVRGQWGELTLKRLAELAGMVEHCDFYQQENVKTDEGRQRPDMIVRMPDGREIVVDVKTPLDAYLSAIESSTDEQRQQHMQRHAKNVRQRINELHSKAYWSQFTQSPEFVVLFIPGDQFLSAALETDYQLMEDALSKNVILATPTSFVALLRAVAYGWRQEQLAKNAEHIKKIGEELYQRLATFTGHLQKMGRSLDTTVKHFNSTVGSFDSRILPSVQKFREMGISSSKEIEAQEQVESGVRQIETDPDNDQ